MTANSRPKFCLIVEDEAQTGLDLADALEAEGFFVAGPLTSGKDALDWLERFTPDIAVIDPVFRDGVCDGLVSVLQERGVPVVIYSAESVIENLLPSVGAARLQKPCLWADMISILSSLLC